VREEEVTEIAAKTLEITRLVRNNPRVPNVKDLEKLLRDAL
jgi:alcohol dehydrogenase class IV